MRISRATATTGGQSGCTQRGSRLWCWYFLRRCSATRRSRMPPSKEPRRREEKVRPFRPRPMRLSVLTAALQELTPRERRDADPDLAVEEWLQFARELECPNIELSAALHPAETDVSPEAMLDPVANTLDLRRP